MSFSMQLAEEDFREGKRIIAAEAEKIQTHFELAVQFLRSEICSVGEGGSQAFDGEAAKNMLQLSEQVRNLIAGRVESLGVALGNEFSDFVESVDNADENLT